jgi:hypothetical protein
MGMLRTCNEHDCQTKTLGSHCINHESPAKRRGTELDDSRSAESAKVHEPVAID